MHELFQPNLAIVVMYLEKQTFTLQFERFNGKAFPFTFNGVQLGALNQDLPNQENFNNSNEKKN